MTRSLLSVAALTGAPRRLLRHPRGPRSCAGSDREGARGEGAGRPGCRGAGR